MNDSRWVRPTVSKHEWLRPAAESLADAHKFWHDAAGAYHDPSEFRRMVDALIQASRNVTFRLQADKANGPSFDWYEGDHKHSWRSYLQSVKEMLWLRDARTEITKQKGFSKSSIALISVVDGYLEPEKFLMKASPGRSTEDLVQEAIDRIPSEHRQYQAIEVVRRWEPANLPGRELLGVLRSCFHILDSLLLYAAEISEGKSPGPPSGFVSTVEIPPCMTLTPDYIPLTFEADTGQEISVRFKGQEPTDERSMAALKRYRGFKMLEAAETDTLEGYAKLIHKNSSVFFRREGAVYPIAFLRGPDGVWKPIGIEDGCKREKFLIWRNLGTLTLMNGYDAVIHTGESWIAASPRDPILYFPVSQQPDTQEMLLTVYEERGGNRGAFYSWIDRVGSRGSLGRNIIQTDGLENVHFEPIRRAWRQQQEVEALSRS